MPRVRLLHQRVLKIKEVVYQQLVSSTEYLFKTDFGEMTLKSVTLETKHVRNCENLVLSHGSFFIKERV